MKVLNRYQFHIISIVIIVLVTGIIFNKPLTGEFVFSGPDSLSPSAIHKGLKSAQFGPDLDYARFHQTGTRFMPARKIVFVPKDFARQLGEEVGEYLVFGKKGTAEYRKLKAAVFD